MPGVEDVLWPQLLEYLLQPELTAAAAALAKALSTLALRRRAATADLAVSYQNLQVGYRYRYRTYPDRTYGEVLYIMGQ